MNKKRIWLVLPAVILPYLELSALIVIHQSSGNSAAEFIMEHIFNGDGLLLAALVLLFGLFAVTLSICCFVLSIRNNWDALSLAKTGMILKLCQLPAYLMILIVGVMLLLSIILSPIAVVLWLALILTGLLTVAAIMLAVRQGDFDAKKGETMMVLQFVPFADIVASVLFFLSLKKKRKVSVEE